MARLGSLPARVLHNAASVFFGILPSGAFIRSGLTASVLLSLHSAHAQIDVREYHHRAEAYVYGEQPERPGYTNEVKGSGFRVWTAEGAANETFTRGTTASGYVFGNVEIAPLRIQGSLFARGARSGEAVWTTGAGGVMVRATFEISQPHGYTVSGSVTGSGFNPSDGTAAMAVHRVGDDNRVLLTLSSESSAGDSSAGASNGIILPGRYYFVAYASGKGIQYGSRSTFGSASAVFDLQLVPTNVVPGTTAAAPLLGRSGGSTGGRARTECRDDRCLTNVAYCFNCVGDQFVVPGTNAWIQVPAASGVELSMSGSNRFTVLTIPSSADTNRVFSVTADGVLVGEFKQGDSIQFTEGGAQQVLISGVQTYPVFEEVPFVVNVGYSRQAEFEALPFPAVIPLVLERAGDLLVDLRPHKASRDTWTNLGSLGAFTGNAPVVPNVAGTTIPGVEFVSFDNFFTGPNSVPDLEGDSDRSVEVWAYTTRSVNEATLASWGLRGAAGQNFALTHGTNGNSGAAAHEGSGLGWTVLPEVGRWHHFACTYSNREIRVFVDGVLDNRLTLADPLNTATHQPINLGFQRLQDGRMTNFFDGYINTVRIHGGALTPRQVERNYLFGPWLTNVQPQIVLAAESAVVHAGEPALITATILDSGEPIESMSFHTKELFLGSAPPPFAFAATNLPPGTNTVFATVTDRAGITYLSAPVNILVRAPELLPSLKAIPAGGILRIQWPDVQGAQLFKSTSLLDSAAWSQASGASGVESGERWLELPMEGSAMFFQLRRFP